MINKRNTSMILTLLILAIGSISCSKDDSPDPVSLPMVKVAFDSEVHEPGGDITSFEMNLKLDQNASSDGYIHISLAGKMVYGQQYYTEPAATNGVLKLPLTKNRNTAKFTVHKLADLATGENILQMILKDPSKGFSLGDPSISLLKFEKGAPEAAYISFTAATAEVWEDDQDGVQIALQLTKAQPRAEQLTIDFQWPEQLKYGVDFFTEPALVLGELHLEIEAGKTTASFKVIPVNNHVALTDYQINLKISSVTGYIAKGDQDQLILTLRDDDDSQVLVHNISELRQTFEQYPGDWYLPEDYYIEGVITSATNVVDAKYAYIQDTSGGIMLRFNPSNLLEYGDKVRLNLKNASGTIINGQKSMINITDRMGTQLDTGVYVQAEDISLEQLATGDYSGKKVRISGVQFADANGTNTFEGSRAISTGSFSAVVKTYSQAEFKSAILPSGTISIQGIIGDFGYILPQKTATDIQL